MPEPGIVVEHLRLLAGPPQPQRPVVARCTPPGPRPSASLPAVQRAPRALPARFASLLAQCLGLTVDGPRVVPPRVVCFALVVASFRLLA